MEFQALQLFFDTAGGTGQDAGADAIGLLAQAQIEAGGLDLIRVQRTTTFQRAAFKKGRDLMVGKDALLAQNPIFQ